MSSRTCTFRGFVPPKDSAAWGGELAGTSIFTCLQNTELGRYWWAFPRAWGTIYPKFIFIDFTSNHQSRLFRCEFPIFGCIGCRKACILLNVIALQKRTLFFCNSEQSLCYASKPISKMGEKEKSMKRIQQVWRVKQPKRPQQEKKGADTDFFDFAGWRRTGKGWMVMCRSTDTFHFQPHLSFYVLEIR